MKNIRDPFVTTPESFHLAVENTLLKLEDNKMMRKVKWPALMIAAVLVMIAATGFAAAGLVKGMVDWDGNLTPVVDPVGPNPTPTPWPVPAVDSEDSIALTERMHDMLAYVPDFEYWEVQTEFQGSGRYGQYTSIYYDLPSFLSAVSGFDDLNLSMPDGYVLQNAEMFYDLAKIQKELYSEETYDKITLRKYLIAPPTDEMRDGYGMRIVGEEDKNISVHVFVYSSYDEAVDSTGTFYVDENDQYSVLEIEGYERALLFERGNGATLIELIRTTEDGRAFTVSLYGNTGVSADEMLKIIGGVIE